jgi:hypothetical protein
MSHTLQNRTVTDHGMRDQRSFAPLAQQTPSMQTFILPSSTLSLHLAPFSDLTTEVFPGPVLTLHLQNPGQYS